MYIKCFNGKVKPSLLVLLLTSLAIVSQSSMAINTAIGPEGRIVLWLSQCGVG